MRRAVRNDLQVYRREFLPYGKWTCADGREILFNRYYQPIWQRLNGRTTLADIHERVPFITQEWFYDDSNCRDLRIFPRLERILTDFGIWERQ